MIIPINLIITTLLFGLIILLAYIFLNKLTQKSNDYVPPENFEMDQGHNQNQNNSNINRNINLNNNQENLQNPDAFKKLTKKNKLNNKKSTKN